MDRMQIAEMNGVGSFGGGARYLYNDLHEDQNHETLDLLQMVPDIDRLPQNGHQPGQLQQHSRQNNNRTAPEPPPRIPILPGSQTLGRTSCSERQTMHSFYGGGSNTLGGNGNNENGGQVITPLLSTGSHLEHPEEHPHLCHKHARQYENKANTLYDRHPGYGGIIANNTSSETDPYYSKVHTLYKETPKDKTDVGAAYFNYLRHFKRKGSERSRSTQSLPAVTYTFNNKHTAKNGALHLFSKTSNLFRNSNQHRNNHQNNNQHVLTASSASSNTAKAVNKMYSTSSVCKEERDDLLDKDSSYTGIKRLLIIVCILVGVILALGGIIIGFVVLPVKARRDATTCSEGYLYCSDTGCVPVTSLCEDIDFVCPGDRVNMLAMCAEQENKTMGTSPGPYLAETRPRSVTSDLIYDESKWVHYVNITGGESMYHAIDKVMPFTAAQEECRRFNGHLAHVTDIREQVFIEDYLTELYSSSEFLVDSQGLWLGARRQRGSNRFNCMVHKQWHWVDVYGRTFGIIDGFSAFGNGKPDDYYNPEECLYINTQKVMLNGEPDEGFLKWDDAPCDDLHINGLRPLCEVEIKNYPYRKRT